MYDVFAFQLTLTGSAQQLPAHPIGVQVTIQNASAVLADAVYVGASSAVSASNGFKLNGNVGSDTATLVTLPMAGGNTNQLWVIGTSGQPVCVIGL